MSRTVYGECCAPTHLTRISQLYTEFDGVWLCMLSRVALRTITKIKYTKLVSFIKRARYHRRRRRRFLRTSFYLYCFALYYIMLCFFFFLINLCKQNS